MIEQSLPLWTEWVRWTVEVLTPIAAVALVIATLLLVNKTRIVAVKPAELVEKTKDVADRTAELVKETIIGTDQLDRHHQEALLPMVYVDAELTLRTTKRSGPTLGQEVSGLRIDLEGDLVNVGPGPATIVKITVYPAPLVERSFYQGLIGANSRRPLNEIDWWLTPPPSFGFKDGQPWPFTVTTEYTTLFDGVGHVYQRSHSGYSRDLYVDKSEKPTIRPRRLQEGSLSVTATAVVAPPAGDR